MLAYLIIIATWAILCAIYNSDNSDTVVHQLYYQLQFTQFYIAIVGVAITHVLLKILKTNEEILKYLKPEDETKKERKSNKNFWDDIL